MCRYVNKPTETVTYEEFQRVFNINVGSIFHSINAFVPYFKEQKDDYGGNFINISSTAALRPRPGLVWYNASKGAVSNVSR